MKNNFLTIPDAPNYEINSDLICRNKSTGRILKPTNGKVTLYCDETRFIQSIKNLRRQAVAALSPKTFCPIPSTGYKYEIDSKGNVRHARTKRPLKIKAVGSGIVKLYCGNKKISRSIRSLLAEVFGLTFKSLHYPVVISKGNQRFYFDSKTACALFLAKTLFYSPAAIRRYLSANRTLIHGWHINYLI